MADEFVEINIGLEEVWSPEKEGDSIQGTLAEKKIGVGANESEMYILDTKEGRRAIWSSTVLRTKMAQVNLLDEVRIIYKGEVKSEKTGRTYKDFSVGIKKNS